MALELTLQALARSPEFNMMKDKNWNAISKMIPGSTPRQVNNITLLSVCYM